MPTEPTTVLVVEDDTTIAMLLRFLLERQGWQVQAAADGAAALQAIQQGPVPRLVLLDFMLPVHDGLFLLERLRAQPGWERVPVVMLSGKGDEAMVQRAMAAGATDYVVKPFDALALGEKLAALVG